MLRELKKFYKENNRAHLPWRKTHDPYRILVSEMMLQQTQVERVLPKYREFLRAFPSFAALAKAPFSQVLFHWSGLGYNRRARFLHDAAKVVVRDYAGTLPRDPALTERLPGIGHYTARAVAAFAFDSPEVFVETNIRTVFFHSQLLADLKIGAKSKIISDAQLLPLVEKALRESNMPPREFYAALMDYGSYLKKSGVKLNSRSAHYAKQSAFEGSARELRGAILRELLQSSQSAVELKKKSERTLPEIERELSRLAKDGLVIKKGKHFSIAK